MNTSLLLVTYNRENLLKKCIDNIENYASGIKELIIVDNNSSDGTLNYLKNHFAFNSFVSKYDSTVANSCLYIGRSTKYDIDVSLICLSDNTGGSGGFHEGVKYFRDNSKNEWLWGMDDDAFVQAGAYYELTKVAALNKDIQAFWSNCNNDHEFNSNTKPVNDWMFVGFYISRTLISEVGLPVADYFIYHDDSEYAMRILRNNFKILKVKNSIIKHGDLNDREYWERNIFRVKFRFPAMSKWKLYYFIRNDIHKHSYCNKMKFKRILRMISNVVKLMLVKPSVSLIAIKALFHGVVGIKGKVMLP